MKWSRGLLAAIPLGEEKTQNKKKEKGEKKRFWPNNGGSVSSSALHIPATVAHPGSCDASV